MAGPGPSPFHDLPEAYQQLLLEDATEFADRLVHSYRWRGTPNGVLPEGYDPSSLAAEALVQLCAGSPRANRRRSPLPRTPRRLPSPGAASVPRLLSTVALSQPKTPRSTLRLLVKLGRRLRRLIRRQLTRLHHLKENRANRNEPDLSLETLEDGDQLSPIDFIPGPERTPAEILIEAEEEAQTEKLKAAFAASLGSQRRLKALFHHLCADNCAPKTLARKLRLPLSLVKVLKDKLRRRFRAFQRAKTWYKLQK